MCQLVIVLDAERYRTPEKIDILAVIAGLEAKGAIANALFVFISEESSASRWAECPCHPPFADFILQEVLPRIETLHPEARNARERVLVGLGYTGLAAAFVALRSAGRFHWVVAQSGSFWWNQGWILRHLGELGGDPGTRFYLDVGLEETAENVRHKEDVLQVISQIEGVRGFRDALREAGHEVRYVEYEGGHDYPSWRKTLPGALRWALPRHL